MTTVIEVAQGTATVDDDSGYVHVTYPTWKAVGPMQLTPPQARMLARVLRGSADEIDRRVR